MELGNDMKFIKKTEMATFKKRPCIKGPFKTKIGMVQQ